MRVMIRISIVRCMRDILCMLFKLCMYGGLGVKLGSNSGLEKDMFTGALSLTSSNTIISSLPTLETVGTITSESLSS